jgi:hypothetical protein
MSLLDGGDGGGGGHHHITNDVVDPVNSDKLWPSKHPRTHNDALDLKEVDDGSIYTPLTSGALAVHNRRLERSKVAANTAQIQFDQLMTMRLSGISVEADENVASGLEQSPRKRTKKEVGASNETTTKDTTMTTTLSGSGVLLESAIISTKLNTVGWTRKRKQLEVTGIGKSKAGKDVPVVDTKSDLKRTRRATLEASLLVISESDSNSKQLNCTKVKRGILEVEKVPVKPAKKAPVAKSLQQPPPKSNTKRTENKPSKAKISSKPQVKELTKAAAKKKGLSAEPKLKSASTTPSKPSTKVLKAPLKRAQQKAQPQPATTSKSQKSAKVPVKLPTKPAKASTKAAAKVATKVVTKVPTKLSAKPSIGATAKASKKIQADVPPKQAPVKSKRARRHKKDTIIGEVMSDFSGYSNDRCSVVSGLLEESICFECGLVTNSDPWDSLIICDSCEGEYHICCVFDVSAGQLPPRATYICKRCKQEEQAFLDVKFHVHSNFKIPKRKPNDKSQEKCYSPSRPLVQAWKELEAKGFMCVSRVFPYDVMRCFVYF